MENYQFFTIIGMLAAGFGWLIHKMSNIETRLTIVETVLSMMGMPVKPGKNNKE